MLHLSPAIAFALFSCASAIALASKNEKKSNIKIMYLNHEPKTDRLSKHRSAFTYKMPTCALFLFKFNINFRVYDYSNTLQTKYGI